MPKCIVPTAIPADASDALDSDILDSGYRPAVWDILLRMGARPDQVAAVCADMTELEAAAALKRAETRLALAETEKRRILRGAEPVRETREQKIVARALRSGLTCPSGPG